MLSVDQKKYAVIITICLAVACVSGYFLTSGNGDGQSVAVLPVENGSASGASSPENAGAVAASPDGIGDDAEDEAISRFHELLDDDQESECLAAARDLARSPNAKCRYEAIKAFEWYGGEENLQELFRLVFDADLGVAECALDSYEMVFRSLEDSPGAETMASLKKIILDTSDTDRLESLFALTQPLDEVVSLPCLVEILQAANEDGNDELADLAREYIDFATEQDSGIDSLEKAQQWLDRQASDSE